MDIKVYKINAFTDKLPGGNPAGVVLDSGKLSKKQMQSISREINLSETAFVEMIKEDYFKVRFFTPICEVELCGHATIAAFYLLGEKAYIKPDKKGKSVVLQETLAGKLEVELIFKDGKINKILMEQSTPKSFGSVKDLERLADIMGIKVEDIGIKEKSLSPEIISTGLKDIMLPIKSEETLDGLDINMEKLEEYSREMDVTGVHAFYLPSTTNNHVFTRNFAPAVGIDEESATGTSNGALIFFLKHKGFLKGKDLIAYQGENMGMPSEIYCQINKENGKYKVKVGGKAITVKSSVINI